MADRKIKINRAPVLTLWAAVVAERLGYEREMALTLGEAVAGLNAQAKGQRLGIYEPKTEEAQEEAREKEAPLEPEYAEIMGRAVPLVRTPHGQRAAVKGETIHSASVEKYLKQKFKGDLGDTRAAMETLAQAPPAREPRGQGLRPLRKVPPQGPGGSGRLGRRERTGPGLHRLARRIGSARRWLSGPRQPPPAVAEPADRWRRDGRQGARVEGQVHVPQLRTGGLGKAGRELALCRAWS